MAITCEHIPLHSIYNDVMPILELDKQITFDQSLDVKDLNCPLPVLKTKLALAKMNPDEILHVEATDPHSKIDFEVYCARTGHEITAIFEKDGVIEFYINRAANPNKI